MIAGPDPVHRLVAGDPAFHYLTRATVLRLSHQNIVNPAIRLEFVMSIRIGVVPSIAGAAAAGAIPRIKKN